MRKIMSPERVSTWIAASNGAVRFAQDTFEVGASRVDDVEIAQ
jgi:hypothetical protein